MLPASARTVLAAAVLAAAVLVATVLVAAEAAVAPVRAALVVSARAGTVVRRASRLAVTPPARPAARVIVLLMAPMLPIRRAGGLRSNGRSHLRLPPYAESAGRSRVLVARLTPWAPARNAWAPPPARGPRCGRISRLNSDAGDLAGR
ncbi:hypothetical protein GCM10010149_38060 [Nonomuraea roseoviolacea subsp. roseoviolacea]